VSRYHFIHVCGRIFFFIFLAAFWSAAILAAPVPLPVYANIFPQKFFTSHPPSQQENPKTVPRFPLSRPGKGKLLVAGRGLQDPNFSQTVVLIIDHSPDGAIGVIINRQSGLKLFSLFPDIESMQDRSENLHIGGPVDVDHMMLLVKTPKKPEDAFQIFEDVYAGGKPELIVRMLSRADPTERFRAYVGYSGWGPGQLEAEVSRGDWHILQADAATVFDKEPSKIWPELILLFSSKWVRSEIRGRWSEVGSRHNDYESSSKRFFRPGSINKP
jgi:putative transcriptional regulator